MNTEGEFTFPTTLSGMLYRMNVLSEEIKDINQQLDSSSFAEQFENDREYRIWCKKAMSARQWKRRERAQLVERYNVAVEKHKQEKRLHPVQVQETTATAQERRRKRLDDWIATHGDDTFTILMAELYAIAIDVEHGPENESPFDEHEMDILRTVRAYLKEKGLAGG